MGAIWSQAQAQSVLTGAAAEGIFGVLMGHDKLGYLVLACKL